MNMTLEHVKSIKTNPLILIKTHSQKSVNAIFDYLHSKLNVPLADLELINNNEILTSTNPSLLGEHFPQIDDPFNLMYDIIDDRVRKSRTLKSLPKDPILKRP
jgi:hypothetical protein